MSNICFRAVVECSTTKGNLTIDIRSNWAPIGADHFLKLIEADLFTNLPFSRVCPRYITQFGVRHAPDHQSESSKQIIKTILKDDNSLWGIRDMDFGYIFYAVKILSNLIIFLKLLYYKLNTINRITF